MQIRTALELAKRVQAISQTGLVYSSDEYNSDRYTELQTISHQLIGLLVHQPQVKISEFYLNTKEYPTAKTDIRGVVFNDENQILLVREKEDNKWSLPGGWADIGYSPKQVVVKEVEEETGFIVTAKKLLAVLDKKNYSHPPQLDYVYKFFIECTIKAGEIKNGNAHDINGVAFFTQNDIPPLSENRVVRSQIDLMFDFLYNPHKEVVFD